MLQQAMFQSWTSSHGFGQVIWSHISQLLDLNKKDQKWSLLETLRNSGTQVPPFKHGILRSTPNSFLLFRHLLAIFFYLTVISS